MMYGTDIIIDVFTKKNVEHDFLLRELDTTQVREPNYLKCWQEV